MPQKQKGYWQVRGELYKDFIVAKMEEANVNKLEYVKNCILYQYKEYISERTIRNLLNEWGMNNIL